MQSVADVGGHAEMREEGVVLEHQADASLMRRLLGNIDPVIGDGAAMAWFEPGNNAE
jgi:hypothetical protein